MHSKQRQIIDSHAFKHSFIEFKKKKSGFMIL